MFSRPKEPVLVTRTFLPPLAAYQERLAGIWERGYLTNNGPLLQEFEGRIATEQGLTDTLMLGNGTIALQLALRALDITGEVITTPYSYVASTTAILWERCTPVFVDIDPATFCLDPCLIEAAITPRTQAILATHVYGLPCDVEAIEAIAQRHGLKVIYDGAHAFGTRYKGRALLQYGDVATCSLHATKIMHAGEGGTVTSADPAVLDRLRLLRSFGHRGDDHQVAGINGKNSELHAAMGLCVLDHFPEILAKRAAQWQRYRQGLATAELQLATIPAGTDFNHAYFPIVLRSEERMLALLAALAEDNIHPRRYFFPSINAIPYVGKAGTCPVSESIADRVLCLPLFHSLPDELIDHIIAVVKRVA